MTEAESMDKLKNWVEAEIDRLHKEGTSIANTRYYREACWTKKQVFQEVRHKLKELLLK